MSDDSDCTTAVETRIATLTRSRACRIDLIGGNRNRVGIDGPQLDQQQRDRGHTSRDVDALSEPIYPHTGLAGCGNQAQGSYW